MIAEDFGLIEAKESDQLDVAGLLANDGLPLTAYPLDGEAIGFLADTITRHIDATEALPDQQTITIERRSEALVINMCQGANQLFFVSHFLRFALRVVFPTESTLDFLLRTELVLPSLLFRVDDCTLALCFLLDLRDLPSRLDTL